MPFNFCCVGTFICFIYFVLYKINDKIEKRPSKLQLSVNFLIHTFTISSHGNQQWTFCNYRPSSFLCKYKPHILVCTIFAWSVTFWQQQQLYNLFTKTIDIDKGKNWGPADSFWTSSRRAQRRRGYQNRRRKKSGNSRSNLRLITLIGALLLYGVQANGAEQDQTRKKNNTSLLKKQLKMTPGRHRNVVIFLFDCCITESFLPKIAWRAKSASAREATSTTLTFHHRSWHLLPGGQSTNQGPLLAVVPRWMDPSYGQTKTTTV